MKDDVFAGSSVADLNDPVGAACQSGWRRWVQTHGAVCALPAFIGPFAALQATDARAGADLAAFVAKRGAPVLLLQRDDIHVPPQLDCKARQTGVQMVLHTAQVPNVLDDIRLLQTHEADEMVSLARLTKPGPFEVGTHLLGTFIGIREQGQLIAMAGQRMKIPGWVEISAVCVHPDFQGRGLGTRLIRAMNHLILFGGDRPFLHTYKENEGAISLYERLGFRIRSEMQIATVGLK